MSMMQVIVALMKKASAVFNYTTWNPSDKTANMFLSGGNLNAFPTSAANGVRSIIGKSSGKWYWEYTVVSVGGNMCLGVGLATSGLANQLGNGNSGAGYQQTTGTIFYNFGTVGAYTAYSTGAVIGIALDMDGNTVRFYRNNVLQVQATIAAGTWFAQVYLDSGEQITANFGASALVYSPPAGFNAGLYL